MKNWAFVITLAGIFILLGILVFSRPIYISSPEQLKVLEENQKVIISGNVIEEKVYQNSKTLILSNKIQITCKGCPSYLNKNLSVLGVIDKYNNKYTITALKVSSLN